MSQWRLRCEDLHLRRGEREVLCALNLEIAAGACVTIVGPNGAGKTTLLLALMGLIEPARGRVIMDGEDLRRLSPRARGRMAAFVPQSPPTTPGFRVIDMVRAGRFPHVSPLRPLSKEDERMVDQALEQCGLSGMAERGFDRLSGGERQKTMIAAALAQDARILMLDEPTHGLDPAFQIELARLMRSVRERGQGPILVSHDLNLPAALGGRVIALRERGVVADGPAEDILTSERLGAIYDAAFRVVQDRPGRVVVSPDWWSAPRAAASEPRP